MRRLGLLILLGAYVGAFALLFAFASLLPYAQLSLYAGLDSSGRAGEYLDLKGPLAGLSTPALVYVCRDLLAKPAGALKSEGADAGVEGQRPERAAPASAQMLKALKACQPSLLTRGDSVDLALLGRQHAYLWAATKDERHRESAQLFILRSTAASPRRLDAAALNAQSLATLTNEHR